MLTCFYSFKCIDWWHVMYWKRTTGENGTLSLGVADRGSAFLLSAVVGGPSQVWGVCLEAQASCLVDSDSVLAPCNAYQWNATSSPHFFALQSETLGSPSFWPSVDLHTHYFCFSINDCWQMSICERKSIPTPIPSLLCWRSDWVCNDKGDTSRARFIWLPRAIHVLLSKNIFEHVYRVSLL